MHRDTINYSQCWEDPNVLISALQIQPDDSVLSITSGGDNSLALLCAGARTVVSVDSNPSQNYLLELKCTALRHLTYDEYLGFVGVTKSTSRLQLFEKIRYELSPEAYEWWSEHLSLITKGVIHAGRFERFVSFFVKWLLPLMHSPASIETLLSFRDIVPQRAFYQNVWNTPRWRFFFGITSSRLLLSRARAQAMFAHTQIQDTSSVYRERFARLLTTVPTFGNFFLRYSLTGNYTDALPPYLERKGYTTIKERKKDDVQIISNNLLSYLQSVPEASFSKYNLSDIFEAVSPEGHRALWNEIIRTAKPHARVAYWTNLVPRPIPKPLSTMVEDERDLGVRLHTDDRVFFYDTFQVHTVVK